MSLRTILGLGGFLAVLAIACDGRVVLPNNGETSGTGGSSNGNGTDGWDGPNSSSGSTGGSSSSCSFETLTIDRACVPGVGRANTPITIGIGASEGCLGCNTTMSPCGVTRINDQLLITLPTKTCEPPGGESDCPAICALPQTTCTLDPLPAGTYTVTLVGDPQGRPARTLVIANDPAGADRCTLPPAGATAPPIVDTFSKTCTVDTDCRLGRSGDVCSSCGCDNFAFASWQFEYYEATYRERSSLCPYGGPPPPCPTCGGAKATCQIPPDAPTGTCVVTTL
jgi:hypothetical protein